MNTYQVTLTKEQRSGIFSKSTLLLALGIFLVIAPSPDITALAELTQNFIVSMP